MLTIESLRAFGANVDEGLGRCGCAIYGSELGS